MRILHVITTLDPRAGGPSEVVRILVRYAPPGFSSEAVTVDEPTSPFLADYDCPVTALGPARTGLNYSARLLPWLRANRSRFDGVILHGLWQYAGFATRRALHGTTTPYMVFPHGMLDPYFKRAFPLKHLKKSVYWALSEYSILRDAKLVLFTCQSESELAAQSFARHRWNGFVVPFGTVPPPAPTPAESEAFYALCPGARGRRFLLFLGRIHPKKGCDLLVDAFVKIAPQHPDVDLVMAGPDPQAWRPRLEAAAVAAGLAGRIHWPGMLHGDAKGGAFRASEAFVLASHQENFGIAVAESLACGRPVLLSDKVNIAAEIASDGAGFMRPDTAAGTEALLRDWLDAPATVREQMTARAEPTFLARYDMRENTGTILRLFEKQ